MLSLELANKLTGTWVVSWITDMMFVNVLVKVYRVSVCVKQRTKLHRLVTSQYGSRVHVRHMVNGVSSFLYLR